MKICLTASELSPLAKTGGLADVCSALAAFLHRDGHDVRVLIPGYSTIDRTEIDVSPVDFLQGMELQLGPHRFRYSIDAAVLPGTNLNIYLINCPALYDRPSIYRADGDEHLRFLLLTRATFEMCQRMGWGPDVFHCNDWHTALLPLFLKTLYQWDRLFAKSRSLMTIHNIGYQGVFGANILAATGLTEHANLLHQEDLARDRINFLKTGVLYAEQLTTVSPTYAREIQTDAYGMGLQHLLFERRETLTGILNGIDDRQWDPAGDPLIPHAYSVGRMKGKLENKRALMVELDLEYDPEVPLLGMVSRLTSQKGLDLVEEVLPNLLKGRRFSVAVLGSGASRYEEFFSWLEGSFPGRVCFYQGFNNRLAHWVEAGSDMFLMPSVYEPCGLNQMYSQRYGSVPIVRATGGLADSVKLFNPATGEGTGIVFNDFDRPGLTWAITTALDLFADKKVWRRLVKNGMSENFSWDRQGQQYVDLYRLMSPANGHPDRSGPGTS